MGYIKKYIIKNLLVVSVFCCAIFLRFFRLGEFATFLSDQGRDAIIVKNIVTFSHLPAIGASSSIGQVYLGPFYYYLIAPFLPLFAFNPVGLAFGVALFSIIGIIVSYLITKKEVDPKTAFLFLIFVSFSFINIDSSRFSWNPNLLPFFSFLTFYWFYKFLKTKKIIFSILFGSFFSFSLQLHYLAAILIIPIFIFFIAELFKTNHKISFIGKLIISIFSFLFFLFPLIIFDLRHNFLNTKNFIKLFTGQGMLSNSSLISRIFETIQAFFSHMFATNINLIVPVIVLTGMLAIFILMRKQLHLLLRIHLVNIFSYLVFFSLLNSSRHPHYYHPVYLSFFLVSAYLLSLLIKKTGLNFPTLIVSLFFTAYVLVNIQNYNFLFQQPNNQIQHAQNVANFLAEKIDHKPFNIATWPVEFFEDEFVYFLNLKGIIPADRSKVEITNQMFVLCSQEPCRVLNSPSWNISMFGQAKIDTMWTIEGIKIYKLIHTN